MYYAFRSDSDETCSRKSSTQNYAEKENAKLIDLIGKSFETTLKNPRAWSPVRSVGSVVRFSHKYLMRERVHCQGEAAGKSLHIRRL